MNTKNWILTSPNGATYNHIENVQILHTAAEGEFPTKRAVTTFYTNNLNGDGIVRYTPDYRHAYLRGEPGVEITLREECGPLVWTIFIHQRKGNVFIDVSPDAETFLSDQP